MIIVLHDNNSDILKDIRTGINIDTIHKVATEKGLIASHLFDMSWIALAETPTGEDIFIARQTDSIKYNGKEYPVRTFNVIMEGVEHTITIASESLSEAIGINDEYEGTLGDAEEAIDQSIYYYVEDEVIGIDAEEICKDYLDIEMEFVSEEF